MITNGNQSAKKQALMYTFSQIKQWVNFGGCGILLNCGKPTHSLNMKYDALAYVHSAMFSVFCQWLQVCWLWHWSVPTAPSSGVHTETAHWCRPGGLHHNRPHDPGGIPHQWRRQVTKQNRPRGAQVRTSQMALGVIHWKVFIQRFTMQENVDHQIYLCCTSKDLFYSIYSYFTVNSVYDFFFFRKQSISCKSLRVDLNGAWRLQTADIPAHRWDELC